MADMPTEALTAVLPPADDDLPRRIVAPLSGADRAFRAVLRGGGFAVLVIIGLIAVFLLTRAWSAFGRAGWHFFTTGTWLVQVGKFGVGSVLPNGIIVAVMVLIISVPVALVTALFISEYAPVVLRRPLIALIDLMAAIPSIVYALWGAYFLRPRTPGPGRWISDHLGFIPVLRVEGGDVQSHFSSTPFLVALVVSLMVIPIVTSISREVFSQAPMGEREGAYALGSSRWGMIRAVVLPYGRGGMIGAIMLGFGRAMGETIAMLLIISPVYTVNWHVIGNGGNSIPALIGQFYTEPTPEMISALMAAGVVLFVITLAVNALAGMIVSRSRSGLQTAD